MGQLYRASRGASSLAPCRHGGKQVRCKTFAFPGWDIVAFALETDSAGPWLHTRPRTAAAAGGKYQRRWLFVWHMCERHALPLQS
jgi:hypothetical protein